MYPLLLNAPIKDYLWGGTRLRDEFGFKSEGEKLAEAWVLSCHNDGSSICENGQMSSRSLPEILSVWGQGAVGKNAEKFPYFPLLIKLIDAKDSLSVQVHPDDCYALKNEGEFGKTEMWYVVDCDEGASLIYGFNKTVEKEEFHRRILDNTLPEICNYVPVKKGDVFFISAGTLHAIGGGILIAEVQQNSNTTYRVSDFGRLGADGKPRELHIEKALDVTNLNPPSVPCGNAGTVETYDFGTKRLLAQCEFFKAALLSLDGETTLKNTDSFISLLVLSGEITVSYDQSSITAKKGKSVFIPAGIPVSISGKAEILESCV